jgi:hypothetical protein
VEDLNPVSYPATYRPAASLRLSCGLGALMIVGFLAWAITQMVTGDQSWTRSSLAILVAIPTCLVLLAALWFFVGCQVWTTTLYLDRVETRGLLRRITLRRADVAGFGRAPEGTSFRSLRLVPRPPSRSPVIVTAFDREDFAFRAWFNGLSHLDAGNPWTAAGRAPKGRRVAAYGGVDAVEAVVVTELADPKWGPTPDQRRAAFNGARRLSHVLTWTALVLLLFDLITPASTTALILVMAIMPVCAFALVATSQRRWVLVGASRNPRPSVGLMIAASCILLFERAYGEAHIMDWPFALAAAAVIAVGFGAVGAFIERGPVSRTGRVAFMLVCGAFYGWGLVSEVNMRFDSSSVQPLKVAVINKAIAARMTGAGAWLSVTPWSTDAVTEVPVPFEVFQQAEIGDQICISPRRGALGLRWFGLSICDTEPAPPPRLPKNGAGASLHPT